MVKSKSWLGEKQTGRKIPHCVCKKRGHKDGHCIEWIRRRERRRNDQPTVQVGQDGSETPSPHLPRPHGTLWMYHGLVHGLAERVLEYVRRGELLRPGDRVGVAVSGGADSVGLLRLLLDLRRELGVVISVVHFNHKLRGAESDSDQDFVEQLAREYRLQLRSSSAEVREQAASQRISIETAARELRRNFFAKLLSGENNRSGEGCRSVLDRIATGHTLDDQAETVLMRVIRGTGGRGLSGIYPRVQIGESGGAIVRPLLGVRRRELEQYLREIGQEWREDATNRELKFTRNRVRHVVLPLLEKEFNPAIAEGLSELAEIERAEEECWENNAAAWTGVAVQWVAGAPAEKPQDRVQEEALPNGDASLGQRARNERCASVNRTWLLAEPLAMQRRLVKRIGEQAGVTLEFKHVEEILRFAAAEDSLAEKELALPKGWKLVGKGESLLFLAPTSDAPEQGGGAEGYQYRFTAPGSITVAEIGSRFEVSLVGQQMGGYHADDLLDFSLLSNPLTVRNWRAGDRFWPAHRKCEKKVKELLAELKMPQSERKMWPVILSGSEIVWMRGFPVGAKFRAGGNERDRVFVRELAQG